jgi:hypothetical protein
MGADNADSSTAGCDLFVTLVHGTWARGFFPPLREKGTWFAEDSDFRKNLAGALSKHGLSFRMCAFLWSGANSVGERDKAARGLAEHVRARQLEHPNSTQILIAHSHGGNVAFRALDNVEGAPDKNIFIATIATPFVEIVQAKLSPRQTQRIHMSLVLIVIIIKLLTLLWFPWDIPVVITLLLAGVLWLLLRLWIHRLDAKRTAKVGELVKQTSFSSSVRKHPVLILRALDDEASLFLAAAAIGNRLSALIGLLSYRILWLLAVAPFLGVMIYVAVRTPDEADLFNPLVGPWADRLILWGIYIYLFGLMVFLLAPGAFKSAYGRELLFNSQGCQINSQSAPDSIDRQSELGSERASWGMVVTLYRDDYVRRGLRHGLYDDPQCAERIAAWVAANRR